MPFSRALIAATVLAALSAGQAAAADRLVVREEVVPPAAKAGRDTTGEPRRSRLLFNLLGLHWKGAGSVEFRTALEPGAWSVWQAARPEAEDGPDAASPEAGSSSGWKLGNPYWTGSARYVEYRFSGQVRRLRAYYLWSEPADMPVASADATSTRTGTLATRASRPAIITRAQWGADESIVRGSPFYAERVRFSVVHHTAGTNSYSSSESAAIVRGIHRYHVLANGWNDIGYNFLVDKYGRVFEGRAGGMDRNVVGAHAQGFNTGSVGVSVLGTYESRGVSTDAFRAVRNLLAWRLDVAHVDPASRLTWISGGNPKYPAGTAVRLRAVSGHRDTGPTSCPGTTFYGQLPNLAVAVAARGLPKLYDPGVAGALGGPVTVTGRLSTSLPWTVTIRDAGGTVVSSGGGSGTQVSYTWDASAVFFGAYTYTITAGPDVRPATYAIPGPPKLEVTSLAVSPAAVTPNGDGHGEQTTASFKLTTAATGTVTVETLGGVTQRTLASSRSLPRGTTRIVWDGRNGAGALVPDGQYRIRVAATSPGQSASRTVLVVVDRTLGWLTASPAFFSPNGDGRAESTMAGFTLARQADVTVRVRRSGETKATLFTGTLAAGGQSFEWTGRTAAGAFADGAYRLLVTATTSLGTRRLDTPVAVDTRRPALSILRVRRGDTRTRVRIWLSEPATLRVWWGTPTWRDGSSSSGLARPAGTSRFRLPGRPVEVKIVAFDAALNRSRSRVARAS